MASGPPASGESQKQLLSLIRDFATEKSHGERRVSDLKRRLADVRAGVEAATGELDTAKRGREAAEQGLRGSQVQLSMATASIQALEARISQLQEEIAKMGYNLDALKNKEDNERDEFISKMIEFNTKIRQFQEQLAEKGRCVLPFVEGEKSRDANETLKSEGILKGLVDKMNHIDYQVHLLEGEYENGLLDRDKVSQELADINGKRTLMEAVMDEMKQLRELGWQTAELEKVHASLGEELRRRYACPGCGTSNIGELEVAEN